MKRIVFVFISISLLFLSTFQHVRAAGWDSEGVGAPPSGSSGTTICDHHDSAGDCLFSVSETDGGQAWQGHFSATVEGTAGVVGPGNTRITACLSDQPYLWGNGACWV